jgi:hypothetical protein
MRDQKNEKSPDKCARSGALISVPRFMRVAEQHFSFVAKAVVKFRCHKLKKSAASIVQPVLYGICGAHIYNIKRWKIRKACKCQATTKCSGSHGELFARAAIVVPLYFMTSLSENFLHPLRSAAAVVAAGMGSKYFIAHVAKNVNFSYLPDSSILF